MQYVNPFRAPGRWYRGNTHTHTTQSDGRVSVPDRFAAYRDAGYDFLALTDHHRVSDVSAFTDKDFLAISGTEMHPANPYGGELYHLVALDVHEPIPTEGRHPNEVIAAARAQGGHVIIAHPYWCGHTVTDLLPIEGAFAVEVHNETCAGIGKAASEPHWDDLLDRKGPLLGVAVDDCHGDKADCFGGWVMVKSESLTKEGILGAMLSGSFYSTTGPTIEDLDIVPAEGTTKDGKPKRKVVVRTSPARSIVFKARCYMGGRCLAPEGQLMESAEYVLRGGERYVRVEVTDAQGRKAWSNPLFV